MSVAGAIASGLTFAAIPLLRKAVPSLSDRKADLVLIKLLPPDDTLELPALRFQYFPESINDSKQVNYANRQIPGGSLPLYHWISGGERIISFTAVFSTDVDLSLKTVQDYASDIKNFGLEDRNVDVGAALLWLRSFLMPTYDKNNGYRPLAPPKAILAVRNTGLGVLGGADSRGGRVFDSVRVIMTQCDIEHRAFFPSGNPRIASVSLSFAQIAQSAGAVEFPGYDEKVQTAIKEGVTGIWSGGYNLPEKD